MQEKKTESAAPKNHQSTTSIVLYCIVVENEKPHNVPCAINDTTTCKNKAKKKTKTKHIEEREQEKKPHIHTKRETCGFFNYFSFAYQC